MEDKERIYQSDSHNNSQCVPLVGLGVGWWWRSVCVGGGGQWGVGVVEGNTALVVLSWQIMAARLRSDLRSNR